MNNTELFWKLGDCKKELDANPDTRDPLISVEKTCKNCGTHYKYWDIEECDGENAMGIWFTCKAYKDDDTVCGSTMLYLSEAQKKKLKTFRKSKQDA